MLTLSALRVVPGPQAVGALQILSPNGCQFYAHTSAPKPLPVSLPLFYDTYWAPTECQALCKGLGAQWWQNNGPVLKELTFKLGINNIGGHSALKRKRQLRRAHSTGWEKLQGNL